MSLRYDDSQYGVLQTRPLRGNAGTTPLLTPQVGTGAETKTHTTTLLAEGFQKSVIIKKLLYTVKTAATGSGNTLALDLYNGTTSAGSLAVTTEAANAVATSSDINCTVSAGSYIKVYCKALTTASDGSGAIGNLEVTYLAQFV